MIRHRGDAVLPVTPEPPQAGGPDHEIRTILDIDGLRTEYKIVVRNRIVPAIFGPIRIRHRPADRTPQTSPNIRPRNALAGGGLGPMLAQDGSAPRDRHLREERIRSKIDRPSMV